jgi:hypothetical protein
MAADRELISFSIDRAQGAYTGQAKVGGDVTIILNPRNIEQCRGIANLILSITMTFHGIEAADSIMRQAAPTRRQIQAYKNFILLHAAKGMSPGRAAAKLAEENKSILPSSLERRIRRKRNERKK